MWACWLRRIIQNEDGNWIIGFSKYLGCCSAFKTEAWGVLEGLQLARDFGFKKVELKSDSHTLVQTVIQRRILSADLEGIYNAICSLLGRDWDISVKHKWRQGNSFVD